LTLRPAFDEADRARVIDRLLHEAPPPPRAVDPRISRDLETVVLKCLARDPRDRYPTADALADDLRQVLADRPVRARRAGPAERAWRWCRRNPGTAALAAATAALLAAVAAVATAAAVRLEGERNEVARVNADLTDQYRETRAAERRATAERARAEAAERATRDRLWLAHAAEGRALRTTRQAGQRYGTLRAVRAALALPLPAGRSLNELRTEAVAALCLPDFEPVKEWDGCPPGTTAFALDRDFARYARADQAGRVSVRRVADDAELASLPGAGPSTEYEGLRFSPDGRFLHVLAVRPPVGRLWRLDGPGPTLLVDDDHGGFAFSPDSRTCAVAYPTGAVALVDTETGRETGRFAGGFSGPRGMIWNPRLPRLALWAGDTWQLLDVGAGAFGPPVRVPGDISWAAWHPDGRRLAVSNGSDFRIAYWDTETRRPAGPPMEGARTAGIVLSPTHAGDRLLSTDWSGLWRLWDVRSGQQLLALPSPGTNLQFTPDDGRVGATVDPPRVRLYRFAAGAEFASLRRWQDGRPGRYDHRPRAVLHPGGRLLAVAAYDALALVDLARMEEVGHLPEPFALPLAFTPDGTALVTCGTGGLCRWPVRPAGGGDYRLGPPERLLAAARPEQWAASGDLGTVAIPEYSDGATVWRGAGRAVRLGQQNDVRYCAVSPDGRWVFTGSHIVRGDPGARVWDLAADPPAATDLPTDGNCAGWFSPDGRWLVTGGYGYRTWAVGSWAEAPSPNLRGLAAGCAFSADGRVMALSAGAGGVRLVEPATGREVASLTAPERSRLVPVAFTPDGGRLAAVGAETQALHVFDLAAIRAGLRELGLDWDAAPIPAAARPPDPLRVTVDPRGRATDGDPSHPTGPGP
ncbi:MAG TPA: hypothetical protein VH092_11080, partial [Urbifossiella sp.]|nr:hypothetical protein [Urbifossiella sp.]